MKIARTFTIDYHIYQELRKKSNQSRFVERAIKKSLSGAVEFSIQDFHTKQILSALLYRDDCPESIKILIDAHLTSS